jgi:hypothetical protein
MEIPILSFGNSIHRAASLLQAAGVNMPKTLEEARIKHATGSD